MEVGLIRENTLVEHSELGVGRIVEIDGARVRFKFDTDYEKVISMAEATSDKYRGLPDDGLEARYIKDPDEVISWVYDGQLRLVGAALADTGSKGTVGEIQKTARGAVYQAQEHFLENLVEKDQGESGSIPSF